MPARAIASATISFGLVSIPVKLYTATASKQVRFNMLHEESKSRVKQQYVVPNTGEIVQRKDLVKGYEYAKGQYVIFSEEELQKLEADRSTALDIVEFVPLSTVELLSVEKSYYLGPDKGGDKAYRLLSQSMEDSGKVAVGRWAARGKEQLVLLRPHKGGLLLHQMFYADEVRSFDEVETGATFDFKEIEKDLARKLIDELSVAAFEPAKYKDDYADRVLAAVDQKVAGQEVQVVHEVPRAQIVDLFEALKQSLAQTSGGASEAPLKKAVPRDPEEEAKTGS